jgi:hypothetical protein
MYAAVFMMNMVYASDEVLICVVKEGSNPGTFVDIIPCQISSYTGNSNFVVYVTYSIVSKIEH